MLPTKKDLPKEKNRLHPQNRHRERYDFKLLIQRCPELAPFVTLNVYNDESIDFANPEAVKMLNKALLMQYYEFQYWDIPPGYLCPPIPGRAEKGHGVSIADIDNDGDQDIHIEMGGAFRGDGYPNSLYMNPGQNNNNWIYLQLEGIKSNRAAVGTKITVKFRENGKERMVYRELNSGGSFGSSPFRREIGIGQATVIDEISINWPASGITQVLKNIQPNQRIKIKEGQEGFEVAELNKIVFKRADGSIPMCAPAK